MQDFLGELVEREPDLARLLINDPEGIDTMLLQFPTYLGNPGQIRTLQEEIEDLWLGDDSGITATSGNIVSMAVTDQITDRQTEAIGTTIAIALGILSIFFWVTLRQPSLGIVAVGPIVLVLISVLGTMALLNIPYTLITSIITALSIGIGVDYTIHIIHRYREEFAHLRNPEQSGDPHPLDHRLGASGLCFDHGVRIWSADSLAAACVPAVRHHGYHNHCLLTDSLRHSGAASYGGLGRLPEHAVAFNHRAHVGRP